MWFMPSVQIIHRICARNKEKRRPVKLVVKRRYGIHRIGRSLPTQFHVRKRKVRIVLYGTRRHGKTIRNGRRTCAVLVRRACRRDKEHLIQLYFRAHHLRRDQMSHVNRVKRSAHDSDALFHPIHLAMQIASRRTMQSSRNVAPAYR